MEKVYLASYKGVHDGLPGIVNLGIQFMDRSKYSHSELTIGHPFARVVNCYSSSGVDHGVRVKQMMLDPNKWDVVCLNHISPEQVVECFNRTRGEKYDYFGTGRFMLPFLLREHPSRWFCSEWVAWVMGYEQPWRFSPAAVHVLAIKNGGAPV